MIFDSRKFYLFFISIILSEWTFVTCQVIDLLPYNWSYCESFSFRRNSSPSVIAVAVAVASSYSCVFGLCPNDRVTISLCGAGEAAACKGDTYIKLLNSAGSVVAANNDGMSGMASCGLCSYATYTVPANSSCSDYNLVVDCSTSTCSGRPGIYLDYFTPPPSMSPTPIYTNAPTQKPTITPPKPSKSPTASPTTLSPTQSPSYSPSIQPSSPPSGQPTSIPTSKPSAKPTSKPSGQPTSIPTFQPTSKPSSKPSAEPTYNPTGLPSSMPTSQPTCEPSAEPTAQPTSKPSSLPTSQPTSQPTCEPSEEPTAQPTSKPSSLPTSQPTSQPTSEPSEEPTAQPTSKPSSLPTSQPTSQPTCEPSEEPTAQPTSKPSSLPTSQPTSQPTSEPSEEPTAQPTSKPSSLPTSQPTSQPTCEPSEEPTAQPTSKPSSLPTSQPTSQPTIHPTTHPTSWPSLRPTLSPISEPSGQPTTQPTSIPTGQPSFHPSSEPSGQPTGCPSSRPSVDPTLRPTSSPTVCPTTVPTVTPSSRPSTHPSVTPSTTPSAEPTKSSRNPTVAPSSKPSLVPSISPTSLLSDTPSHEPSFPPTQDNTVQPSPFPSNPPSPLPSVFYPPTVAPSHLPTELVVTFQPSLYPTATTPAPTHISPVSAEAAPEMVDVAVNASRESVQIEVSMNKAGWAYCAIYLSVASVNSPLSVNEVVLQNHGAVSSTSNISSIAISGLTAAAEYKMYCMSKSASGASTPLSKILETEQIVKTSCCRHVVVSGLASTLSEGINYVSYLRIQLPGVLLGSPIQMLGMALGLSKVGDSLDGSGSGSDLSSFLVPRFWNISGSNIASTLTLSSSLSRLEPGSYKITLLLSGPAAVDYDALYGYANGSSGWFFSVVSASSPLPAPDLSSAVFSADGSYLWISFSGETNRGDQQIQFTCSALFQFSCANQSRCTWIDNANVKAEVASGDSCAVPGEGLSLSSSAAVKAACSSETCSVANVASWPNSSTSTLVRILAPGSPAAPTVNVNIPDYLGSCTPLKVDLTASSGNGGRKWRTAMIKVSAVDSSGREASISELQTLVTSESFQLFPPTLIPSLYFEPNLVYSWEVTLCNFLSSCSTATKKLTTLSTIAPSISILGPSVQTVYRRDGMTLLTQSSLSLCNDSNSKGMKLSYSWSIVNRGGLPLMLSSTSRDPSRFVLPRSTLQVSELYTVRVNVSVLGGSSHAQVASTSSSVQIYVASGNVVASIAGGNQRSLRVGEKLVLDGSSSYDEDLASIDPSTLQYSWSCMQISPMLNDSCSGVFNGTSFASSKSSSAVVLSLLSSASAGSVAAITLVVTSTSAGNVKSGSATVQVTLLASLSPLIEIGSSTSLQTKVANSQRPLQLTSQISVPVGVTGGWIGWSADESSGVKLASAAFTPSLNVSISASSSSAVLYNLYLPLNTAALPMESSLKFTLTCSLAFTDASVAKSSWSSSISFSVNAPPQGGSYSVSPVQGTELIDPFTFLCDKWRDEDLPITYQFGFLSSARNEIVLRSLLSIAFADLQLPAGQAASDYVLTTFAYIYDALGSNSSQTSDVRVVSTSPMSSEAMQTFVATAFSSSGTGGVDGLKQAVAMSGSLLNKVNCTLAPNCLSLHRQACYRTPQTCGPCLSDSYVGEEGDANSMCEDIVNASLRVLSVQNKSCPANCSGHGACMYYSSFSGEVLLNCKSDDSGCIARCDCTAGYIGASCSHSEEAILTKQALRASVLTGLAELLDLEDADAGTVSGWMNYLNDAAQSVDELTASSSSSVLSISSYILGSMQNDSGLSSASTALGLASAIQATLSVATMIQQDQLLSGSSVSRRRLTSMNASTEDANHIVEHSQVILGQLVSVLGEGLVPDQDPVETVQSSFRLHVSKHTPSLQESGGTCSQNTSLTLPRSSNEEVQGLPPSSISLPLCSSSSSPISTAVVTMSGDLYGNKVNNSVLQSDPVFLSFSSFPCADTSCVVSFVLSKHDYLSAISSLQSAQSSAVIESFNVSCSEGDFSHHVHLCASDGASYELSCRGEKEILHGICPAPMLTSACSVLIGMSSVDYGCQVTGSTADNITCSCPLLPPGSSFTPSSGMSISAANNVTSGAPSGSISINYISLLRATYSSFTSTVLSADDLSAGSVTHGYRVLVTISSFVAVVGAALLFSHRADQAAQKINPDETQEKKKGKEKLAMALQSFRGFQKDKKPGLKKLKLKDLKSKAQEMPKRGLLAMAEEALPNVLRARSLQSVVKEEMKHHHRWFGVIFHYSEKLPRVLRVASLATNIIIMLFIQSVTYNLTKGDDGSCERMTSESSCLEEPSAFATGESKCYWTADDGSDSNGGHCSYLEPGQSVKVVLFVAIFSALVSTPIALLADYIVNKYLAAPSQSVEVAQRVKGNLVAIFPDKGMASSAMSLLPMGFNSRGSVVSGEERANGESSAAVGRRESREAAELSHAQAAFRELSEALRGYLGQLASDVERAEFRELWGMDESGRFLCPKKRSTWRSLLSRVMSREDRASEEKEEEDREGGVGKLILGDLLMVEASYSKELSVLQSRLRPVADVEKSKRLLYLFQKDLLPGISGQILESKDARDHMQMTAVSKTAKAVAWAFLFLLNGGMLFYIFLFAISQDSARQSAWAKSFAMWLVAEIFFVSTCMVLLTHVALPAFIMKDVQKIKKKLADSLLHYHRQIRSAGLYAADQAAPPSQSTFNAAEYLFVSYRLAKAMPKVKTAQIISRYSTVWPRQSYQHVVDLSKSYDRKYAALTRSASLVVVFFLTNLLSVPLAVQDMVVHMASTAAIGYTFLVHIQLYTIYPVLVIIPTLFVGVVVHFLLRAAGRSGKSDLFQTLPNDQGLEGRGAVKELENGKGGNDGVAGAAMRAEQDKEVGGEQKESDNKVEEFRPARQVPKRRLEGNGVALPYGCSTGDEESEDAKADEIIYEEEALVLRNSMSTIALRDNQDEPDDEDEDDFELLHHPSGASRGLRGLFSSSSSCSFSSTVSSDSDNDMSVAEVGLQLRQKKSPLKSSPTPSHRRQTLQQGLDLLVLARQQHQQEYVQPVLKSVTTDTNEDESAIELPWLMGELSNDDDDSLPSLGEDGDGVLPQNQSLEVRSAARESKVTKVSSKSVDDSAGQDSSLGGSLSAIFSSSSSNSQSDPED
eukprot:gene9601-10612_t